MKQLTVGDLRAALVNVDDSLPVYIEVAALARPDCSDDYMYYLHAAAFHGNTPISNECFNSMAGQGFTW